MLIEKVREGLGQLITGDKKLFEIRKIEIENKRYFPLTL